jgi:hypothetical protein
VNAKTDLHQRMNAADREKGACKLGERRELTGSLLGGYKFLAAAKRSFGGR